MWPVLERYLRVYRPILTASDGPYLLVSSGAKSKGPWKSLNRRVETLTRKYLHGCPGTGPHAFRHIVATSILKASPNDWETAAIVLHDEVETVRANYGHLSSQDGYRRMATLLSPAFARL